MDQRKKIELYLLENGIQTVKPDVTEFDFPSTTNIFLSKVGIPMLSTSYVNLTPEISPKPKSNSHKYLEIGNDNGSSICIEEKSGRVISVVQNRNSRYINADIRCFILFLIEYKLVENYLINADDSLAESIISKLKSKVELIDSSSLEKEENWWSIVFEQIETGLL